MRNEKLTAYSLHHKTYRDKRSLYYLFTRESGILHGIGKRGVPQFVPLTLFASGKRSLKTLQQINVSHMSATLNGEQQYAALYINEIVLKLLPVEDPLPILFDKYALTIANLRQPLSSDELRLVLRLFEDALFNQIGYGLDFHQDIEGQNIEPDKTYQFVINQGWLAIPTPANSLDKKSLALLVTHIKAVLEKSIAQGGSTLKDFTVADGQTGYFQQTLNVYGKHKDPCPTCNTEIGKVTITGRASTFCPKCQPI